MQERKPTAAPTGPGWGSVRADEVLPLRAAGYRLGMGTKELRKAQRDGLRVTKYGRFTYVSGKAIAEFFSRLAQRQDASAEGGEQ
jgi:hypothetical protein